MANRSILPLRYYCISSTGEKKSNTLVLKRLMWKHFTREDVWCQIIIRYIQGVPETFTHLMTLLCRYLGKNKTKQVFWKICTFAFLPKDERED